MRLFQTIPALAVAPFFLGAALSCSSGPKPGREEVQEEPLPSVSMLLPSPLENEARSEQERMLRLFSAPVLNLGLIEDAAETYEATSRKRIAERQADLAEHVCGLPGERREREIERLRILQRRQYARWRSLQARYEASLRYQLERDVDEHNPAQVAELDRILQARKAVQLLQAERQSLVGRAYDRYLANLAGGLENGCSPAPAVLPREQLYRPYYLALYRFLSLMAPGQRSRLLLELHKP